MEPNENQENQAIEAYLAFDAYAHTYAEKFMDFSLYHDTFDRFCEAVSVKNARILDAACGPGNIARYLLGKRPDFQVTGTDLAENMLAIARREMPVATFKILDLKQIRELNASFDGIICGFGLPYLSKEAALQFIADAAEMLNPGGVLYLSTMEDDYAKSGLKLPSSGQGPGTMQYFHEAAYLKTQFSACGLEILLETRKNYDAETIDLILMGQKSEN